MKSQSPIRHKPAGIGFHFQTIDKEEAMRRVLIILFVMTVVALAISCGGGGGGGGSSGIDQPSNKWDSMKWNEGQWSGIVLFEQERKG